MVAVDEQTRRAMLTALGAALLAVIVAIVAARWATYPIHAVAEAANALAAGDMARRVGLRQGDEVGQLAVAFDDMANALAVKEAQLRSYAGQLEQMVQERTADLQAIAIQNARLLEEAQAGREQLRQLAQQVLSAQEVERRRLSRELHDEASQALIALKISLELIRSDLPARSTSLRKRLGEAVALTGMTMEQVHLLAQDLRPPALDMVGLNATLEGFCRDFARRTGLTVDYAGVEPPPLSDAVNICLYRFLQEALTNVAKHAQADRVQVALRSDDDALSLSVVDDGQGFDPQARTPVSDQPKGIGLLGMQERLALLGGRLRIESSPGRGACLIAQVPLAENLVKEPHDSGSHR
jgi:signal transduction histidine kinase